MADLSYEEFLQKIRLVKQYEWLKEEVSRDDAVNIVNVLFQGDHVALHVQERITHEFSSHRSAVELLLKTVILGKPSTLSAFMTALQGPLLFVWSRINETQLSEEEMNKFAILEKISYGQERGQKRKRNPKFFLTYEAEKFLTVHLFDTEIIDKISDCLLSQFYISVGQHNEIVNERRVMDKVQLLLEMMKECSESVQSVLDYVLRKNKMEHVLEGLKKASVGCKWKRSSSVSESHSTKQSNLAMLDRQVVSTANSAQGRNRLSVLSERLFGKKLLGACQKCIVFHFKHNEGDSLEDLKRVCNTEKNIKEFVQGVFEGTRIENLMGVGEFRWKLSMILMQVKQPSPESLARLFDPIKGSSKDDIFKIFVEELDPRRLCKDLKQEGLLDESDEAEMLGKTSRMDRMLFLMDKLTHKPDGYMVLMEHCTMYNKYVIQKLEENEIVMTLRNNMNNVSSQADTQISSDLEVLYTVTVVMKIKEKEKTTCRKSQTKKKIMKRKSETSEEYEITCSHILDPVDYFDDVLKNRATTPQKDLFMVLQNPFEKEGTMSFFKTGSREPVKGDIGIRDCKWHFDTFEADKEDIVIMGIIPDWETAEEKVLTTGKLHQYVLNRHLPNLVEDIDFESVSMYIQQKEILGSVTLHDISDQRTTSDKTRELIKQIQQRDHETYEKFKECLVQAKQEFLKVMLEEEEAKFSKEIKEKQPMKRKRSMHADDTLPLCHHDV